MLKFAFNKLIRDKIVDQQIAAGSKPKYHVLNKEEHIQHLIAKLSEESQEISALDHKEIAGEIADIQQIVDDLKELLGLSDEDIRREQEHKNERSGPIKRGNFEEYVEVDEQNEWVKYYRKNSDRYPEIK